LFGGSEFQDRKVVAIGTSLRNAGICLAIAVNQFPTANHGATILAYIGISIPMNMLFSMILKIATKHSRAKELKNAI
jgi:predicted Na+-dependent transporter